MLFPEVRIKGRISLRDGMWHDLRNGIIICGKRALFRANLQEQPLCVILRGRFRRQSKTASELKSQTNESSFTHCFLVAL